MSQTSGAAVLSFQVFLERAHGEEAYENVIGQLPLALSGPMHGIILPAQWYPTAAFVRAIEVAHQQFGENDLYERYGEFAAEFEITTFQKLLLRFTNPGQMLHRASQSWRRFHQSGEWTTSTMGKTMRGELRGFSEVSEGYCRVLRTWILQAGRLTGAEGEVDHAECRAKGADVCVFSGWWK
jgi:hypothetical protein